MVNRLNHLIKDERKAPNDYRRLLKTLNRKSDKRLIHGIIKDEKRHQKSLIKLKMRLK